MKKSNLSLLPVLLLIMVRMVVFPDSALGQLYSNLNLDPKRVQWSYLVYEVKSASVDVTIEVRMEPSTKSDAEAAIVSSGQGDPLPVPAGGCYKITVNTLIDPVLQSAVKSVDHLWFDPRDATALGRDSFRQGEDDFKKEYRFTRQGVFRFQQEPKDKKEASMEPDHWTKVIDRFYSYDTGKLGCRVITDRLLMTYIASASEMLNNNQPLSLCVFGKRQLFQVKLQPTGLQSLKIDYIEKNEQGETRRQSQVNAMQINLEAKPLESDLEAVEHFSFMGFLNKISFFIDSARNLPVELKGEIPPVGLVTIKLKEAHLRNGSG
jgi:hypothetical protein